MTKENNNDIGSGHITFEEERLHSSESEIKNKEKKSHVDFLGVMGESCGCKREEMGHLHYKENRSIPKSYVYALGKISYRFPNRSLEMELAQIIGDKPAEDTNGLSGEETVYQALSDPNNSYIARQLCYVMLVEHVETYLLVPSDPLDFQKLADALKAPSNLGDMDVIIGIKGPIAPPDMCNGLMLPIVKVDKIYSFDRETLIKAIPRQEGISDEQFSKSSSVLFNQILQLADNAGSTDEHRAINYLAVRYGKIYETTQQMQNENYPFTGMEVRPSRLSGLRKVVDVIFSYEDRTTRAVRRWFARVDVTEEFPFLVSPLQEYYER